MNLRSFCLTLMLTLVWGGGVAQAARYTVQIKTGGMRYAGTDADVWIELYGTKGSTSPMFLDTSNNDFEQGHLDTFGANDKIDIGEISGLKIYHNNRYGHPGWFLESVCVAGPSFGATVFPVGKWLATDEPGDIDKSSDGHESLGHNTCAIVMAGSSVQPCKCPDWACVEYKRWIPEMASVFYFRLERPSSSASPCMTVAISARSEAEAEEIVGRTYDGYTSTSIDQGAFERGCN